MLRIRRRATIAASQHFAAAGDAMKDGLHRICDRFTQDLRELVFEVRTVYKVLRDALLDHGAQ
jgi:hypothetical protein